MNELHIYHSLLSRLGQNPTSQDALSSVCQQTLAPLDERIPPTLSPRQGILQHPFTPTVTTYSKLILLF